VTFTFFALLYTFSRTMASPLDTPVRTNTSLYIWHSFKFSLPYLLILSMDPRIKWRHCDTFWEGNGSKGRKAGTPVFGWKLRPCPCEIYASFPAASSLGARRLFIRVSLCPVGTSTSHIANTEAVSRDGKQVEKLRRVKQRPHRLFFYENGEQYQAYSRAVSQSSSPLAVESHWL